MVPKLQLTGGYPRGRSLSCPPEAAGLLHCCSCCFSLAISPRCSALPHDAERLWLLLPLLLGDLSDHESGVWVDLSLRDRLLWPSGSLGQCPCRYGPTMASRDNVRLMPELGFCDLAFPADFPSLRFCLGLLAS